MNQGLSRYMLFTTVLTLVLVLPNLAGASDPYKPVPYVQISHPEWSRDATIYQINTRQFTPEGTFSAAEKHLPRLQALGIKIIWLMPVQKIGKKSRKGSLGSPYSIRDYRSVNPEFGDMDNLNQFVESAHELGMYVILDWVANHTAWDNPLLEQHPEWYSRDWQGAFHSPPWTDWSDVVTLDYSQAGLRRYMTESMKFWVEEVGMDGFRCDVAGFVPLDFWNTVRSELDVIRPVFMLAEWETRDLHAKAFDATYAWTWHNTLHDIAMGKANVGSLSGHYFEKQNSWPDDAMRLMFVSNHDKNAWDGTQFELFGDALESVIALSMVVEGIPLIYNGQEAGNPKRLEFFEKDPIEWRQHRIGGLYRSLIQLKKQNSALWNGAWGSAMIPVVNSASSHVFSFVRANTGNKVFAIFNLSDAPQTVRFNESIHHGSYRLFPANEPAVMDEHSELQLEPWSYRIFLQ
jgi:glycosidase